MHLGKYNYSKVHYVNNSTKVTITCNEHGDFTQTPMKHLQGQGCRICAGNSNHSLNSFIEKAKIVHANKFNYEKSKFVNVKTKIVLTCPVHGDFEQIPSEHLSGYGCKSVEIIPNIRQKNLFQKQEKFMETNMDIRM
ncbi:MAG: hypothetical protein IPI30_00160 [Saprospiraceae bacterium]|nr:hypothetical protein [Candidatus Vicinibacter affinis]